VLGQVEDLRAFTSVDADAVVDLDLPSCVQTLLTVIPSSLTEGVSLLTRFGAMPRVRCQAAQVSQALLALIRNALQAVQDRPDKVGAVTIRGGMADEGLFVEVADTGVGMAPEVLARAMEPFFSTRPAGQGLGLGLATASDCAHAHGGRLEATSEPGDGSVFRLWLPLNLH
jgi:two-component system, NtrC family, sensor kinase